MTPSLRLALAASACLLALPSYAQFPHCAGPSPDVEPNDTPATASPLNRAPAAPNHVVPSNGTIDPAGDLDHFRIDLVAGQRLWILVDTSVPAIGSRDSLLRVLAPDGSVLAEDDDDGTAMAGLTVLSQDASAVAGLDAPTTGTYVIRVSAANPSDRMAYRLYTAVAGSLSDVEIEPNDTSPIQPFGVAETHVLGQIGPGDVDLYWGGVLGNGPRMILTDGAVSVSQPTDLALGLENFPPLVIDSSGVGGAEAVMIPEGGSVVRITASPGLTGVRPYRYGLFYIGDSCNLPVSLQSFAIE